MYNLITLNKEGKTFMKQVGRSRRKPKIGRSRRQFAGIIGNDTHKTFINTCKLLEVKNTNNACVLDQFGNLIGFTTYKDTSLPQFN